MPKSKESPIRLPGHHLLIPANIMAGSPSITDGSVCETRFVTLELARNP